MGVFLIAVGVTGAYASITGRLAPAIAGLFDPSDLVGSSSNTGLLPSSPGSQGTPSGGIESLGGANVANSAIASGAGASVYATGQNIWQTFLNGLKGLNPF